MTTTRKYIVISLLLMLIVLCVVGASTWIITNPVSFTPKWEYGKTGIYIQKVVEIDYKGSVSTYRAFKDDISSNIVFVDKDGNKISDISNSDYALEFNTIDNGDLTYPSSNENDYVVGSTYKTSDTTFTWTNSQSELATKYEYRGLYNQLTNEVEEESKLLLIKYKTVQIGSGSINTNNTGTSTQLSSFTSDGNWYTIEDALNNATSSKNNIVRVAGSTDNVVSTSFTLLDDDLYSDSGRTIKKDVTLVLPYDGNTLINTTNRSYSKSALGNGELKKSELVIPKSLTITNEGTISIGGITTGGNGGGGYAGATTGSYAQITLGSRAIINSSGNINAYGFIAESEPNNESNVNMLSDSTILMPFIVMDHRGGSVFAGSYKDLKGSPFNRFFFQNVTSKLVIESDSQLHGWGNLYASNKDNTTTVNFIGNETGYFLQLKDSSKTELKYDINTQITQWDIYGDAEINGLTLNAAGQNISTKEVMFPVTWYWNIKLQPLKEGETATVTSSSQSMKIMPGGEFIIDKGVTLNIPNIYIYDDSFEETGAVGGRKYDSGKGDGKFIVNGTLNVTNIGGYVLTTEDDAQLNISGGTTVTTYELATVSGSSFLATVTWDSATKSVEGDIYNYSGNTRSSLNKGQYTSKSKGWITEDSKFEIKYQFVYHDSDGQVIYPDMEASPNNPSYYTLAGFELSDAILSGYRFMGWYTRQNLDSSSSIAKIVGTDYNRDSITLYGLFKKLPDGITQYKINYVYNAEISGEKTGVDIVESNQLNLYALKSISQEGYTFVGWYKDISLTTLVTSLKEEDFVNDSITLYAKWQIMTYKLSITKGNNTTLNVSVTNVDGSTQGPYTTTNTNLSVQYGATIDITATPSSNYTLTLTVNGNTQSSPCKIKVSGDVEIETSAKRNGGGCFAAGTLITLADGTQKRVEDLIMGVDQILVYDHMSGQLSSTNLFFVMHRGEQYSETVKLYFSNGTMVHVFFGHGFFDIHTNQYEIITPDNVEQYVGHLFYSSEYVNGKFVSSTIELVSYEIGYEYEECYSIYAGLYVNHYVNGVLAVSDSLEGLYNVFELDENMRYDQAKMQADIELYGLFTYEEWSDYCTEEEFYLCNVQYLKVALGKGLVTMEQIYHYFEDFLYMFR